MSRRNRAIIALIGLTLVVSLLTWPRNPAGISTLAVDPAFEEAVDPGTIVEFGETLMLVVEVKPGKIRYITAKGDDLEIHSQKTRIDHANVVIKPGQEGYREYIKRFADEE